MFIWIVGAINKSLGKGENSLPFIGVLDIFGKRVGKASVPRLPVSMRAGVGSMRFPGDSDSPRAA